MHEHCITLQIVLNKYLIKTGLMFCAGLLSSSIVEFNPVLHEQVSLHKLI